MGTPMGLPPASPPALCQSSEMGKKEMRADVSQITAIEIGTDLKGNLCLRMSDGTRWSLDPKVTWARLYYDVTL